MRYPEADRIRDERNAAILAENARLRGESQGLVGITMTQQHLAAVIDGIGADMMPEYLRRRELTDMAAMGRVWEVA